MNLLRQIWKDFIYTRTDLDSIRHAAGKRKATESKPLQHFGQKRQELYRSVVNADSRSPFLKTGTILENLTQFRNSPLAIDSLNKLHAEFNNISNIVSTTKVTFHQHQTIFCFDRYNSLFYLRWCDWRDKQRLDYSTAQTT